MKFCHVSKKMNKLFCCVFMSISICIMMDAVVFASYIGAGVQYYFSMLNYSIDSEETAQYTFFSDIGIEQNNKPYSHDYGFSIFYDDADDFDYLYNTQIRFEYSQFYIPFDKANNAIKGKRMGLIFLLSYDIVNNNDNQVFVGINTGLYYSGGKDDKNGYKYTTMESPLGIVIGDKYNISDYIAIVGTYTLNFYTNLTGNSILADMFNNIEGSSDSFETGRKEMIFNISCAYLL